MKFESQMYTFAKLVDTDSSRVEHDLTLKSQMYCHADLLTI